MPSTRSAAPKPKCSSGEIWVWKPAVSVTRATCVWRAVSTCTTAPSALGLPGGPSRRTRTNPWGGLWFW
jgi:hypothetical protein